MSEPVHVVAIIPTDPAHADAVSVGVAELVTATRAEEGCVSYQPHLSVSTPGVVVMVEHWRSQADLDAHMQTPHIAKAFEVLGPALTGEVAMHAIEPLA